MKPQNDESTDDNSDKEDHEQIRYQNWQSILGRASKTKITTSLESIILKFKSCLKDLKAHLFVKRVQHQHYNQCKDSLTSSDLLVHVDFTESYTNCQQDAIQSAYFGQKTFFDIYSKES